MHVVFRATEDIPAGTELTYMRLNEGDLRPTARTTATAASLSAPGCSDVSLNRASSKKTVLPRCLLAVRGRKVPFNSSTCMFAFTCTCRRRRRISSSCTCLLCVICLFFHPPGTCNLCTRMHESLRGCAAALHSAAAHCLRHSAFALSLRHDSSSGPFVSPSASVSLAPALALRGGQLSRADYVHSVLLGLLANTVAVHLCTLITG